MTPPMSVVRSGKRIAWQIFRSLLLSALFRFKSSTSFWQMVVLPERSHPSKTMRRPRETLPPVAMLMTSGQEMLRTYVMSVKYSLRAVKNQSKCFLHVCC